MISAISGSVIPSRVCSVMLASTCQSSRKARCQATAPAPPVWSRVPSISQRTALITALNLAARSRPSVLALEQFALAQRVEQRQGGQHDQDGYEEDDEDGRQGRVG